MPKRDWHRYNEELVNRGALLAEASIKFVDGGIVLDVDAALLDKIMWEIIRYANPELKHNDTVGQIERIFRKFGFYTTREYPIFRMKDGTDRSGRIDLVARKGKFRVALEYDHGMSVKYKSFQKIAQIKPEIGIAITGSGNVKESFGRAVKYREQLTAPLYVTSLREKTFRILPTLLSK